ncbi:nicotinate-nucleotide adenylyltransferase [Isachenkonia alkalipeptolytica]|uniref:Probable nicotinate-nucleotide adenylyltransferase n=1 Tax=Isachenkonia alkalipeptolytica TaxID=2565777 RepID=A0AA43XN19_9CLOT|nr:nicotinate-nucleotide adenylyltransferase [Isachenkonia alkalipeptolytica]NBG88940.1 nicotinate-nucleotide adenylyltransferase [Isachenkonia alkalipeptolytica]
MKKVGVIGGSFDPIHFGHLRIAQIALEEHHLEEILFIPSGNPPHKKTKDLSPAIDRLNMVKLAVDDNQNFTACDYEIYESGITYTILTIKELQKQYPKGTVFSFILGADAFLDMDSWRDLEEFLSIVELIVLSRSYYKTSKVEEKIKHYQEQYPCNIQTIYAKTLNISATSLRKLVKSGKSLRYLVPSEVDKYIYTRGLYK